MEAYLAHGNRSSGKTLINLNPFPQKKFGKALEVSNSFPFCPPLLFFPAHYLPSPASPPPSPLMKAPRCLPSLPACMRGKSLWGKEGRKGSAIRTGAGERRRGTCLHQFISLLLLLHFLCYYTGARIVFSPACKQ